MPLLTFFQGESRSPTGSGQELPSALLRGLGMLSFAWAREDGDSQRAPASHPFPCPQPRFRGRGVAKISYAIKTASERSRTDQGQLGKASATVQAPR